MKGYLILSEGRSGTNWLGTMANSTNVMGSCREWLNVQGLPKKPSEYDAKSILEEAVRLSSTENGRFSIKLFPRHMHWAQVNYKMDFVKHCVEAHDCHLIFLRRHDRLGQAISWVRSHQTSGWTSINEKTGKENYNFKAISKAFFKIGRSVAFWQNYLGVRQLEHKTYYYEDLLKDPNECLFEIAQHLDVEVSGEWFSPLTIQRDNLSEIWRERFIKDMQKRGELPLHTTAKKTPRTFVDVFRLLTDRHYTYHW